IGPDATEAAARPWLSRRWGKEAGLAARFEDGTVRRGQAKGLGQYACHESRKTKDDDAARQRRLNHAALGIILLERLRHLIEPADDPLGFFARGIRRKDKQAITDTIRDDGRGQPPLGAKVRHNGNPAP